MAESKSPSTDTSSSADANRSEADNPSPDRRGFFLWSALAFVAGGIVSLGPVVAGLFVFLDPLFKRKSADVTDDTGPGEWMKITTLDALPLNEPVRFPVIADKTDAWNKTANQPIGGIYLRKVGEKEVLALNAICPHAGCFVNYSGDDNIFLCPCHNSAFHADLEGQTQEKKEKHQDEDEQEFFGGKTKFKGKNNPSPRPMDKLVIDESRLESGEVWVKFVNYYPAQHEQAPKP